MSMYKVTALVGGIIVFLASLIFNYGTNVSIPNSKFTVNYYPSYFIAIFYLLGAVGFICILNLTFYVLKSRGNYFSLFNDEVLDKKEKLIVLFVKKHLTFILFFIFSYLPNNIILLLQIFMSYRICDQCNYYSICIYMMSLSCTISFVLKITEPYMQKYIKMLISIITRRHYSEDNKDEDYTQLYNGEDVLLENKSVVSDTSAIPLKDFNIKSPQKSFLQREVNEMREILDIVDNFSKEVGSMDFLSRMIAISLSIEEDLVNENDPNFLKECQEWLPWADSYYSTKTPIQTYSTDDFVKRSDTDLELSKNLV